MTLVLKLDLDIVKMYHHTKNEVSMSTPSKVIAQTDTQTDTDTHTHRHDENITSTAYAGGNKPNGYLETIHINWAQFHNWNRNYIRLM